MILKSTILFLFLFSRLNFIFYGISCEKYREELFKILSYLFCCNSKLNKKDSLIGQNMLLQPLDPNGKSALKRNSNTPTFMTTNFNDFKDRENVNQ